MGPQQASAQQVACPVKIGGVLPLTGSMGPITKKIAEAAQLAIEHINQGGGIKGCPVEFVLRDDQGQPTVGVDAAKYLVEVERVAAITGTVSSGCHWAHHLVCHGAVEGGPDQLLLDRERVHAGWPQPGLFLPDPADQQDPGLRHGFRDRPSRPEEDSHYLREHRFRRRYDPFHQAGPAQAGRRVCRRGALQRQPA